MSEQKIVSKSKRTVVTINIDAETGAGLITIDRDDHRWQLIDIPKEQKGIDEEPA